MDRRKIAQLPWQAAIVVATLVAAACAPPAGSGSSERVSPGPAGSRSEPRTLNLATHYEPTALSPKNVESTGRLQDQIRLFNASLAILDAGGVARPYLAETLPELNTPSWRLFPDGAMETTYRLRQNVTWHDGTPLSAEDFVFGARVYMDPNLGMFVTTPQDKIDAVLAPDPQTILIRWRVPYPDAGALITGEFEPLPRHLLERAFTSYEQDGSQRETFANLPFWTTGHEGLGPFRLTRWEPGTLIEGQAFDGHALGRPRIERIVMNFMTDDNTVLSNLLAESIHLALRALRFEQGMALKQAWTPQNRGTVLFSAAGTNTTMVQFRPEFLKVPELMDLRVRKALAHSIDRQGLNDGLFEGQGIMSETYIPPQAHYYAELDRAIAKYPYDPRRSEQLMQEAGLSRRADGFYATASGERLLVPYLVVGGSEYERQGAIMTDTWRRAGFDIQQSILPAVQMRDNHARASFPGVLHNPLGAGERAAAYFTSAQAGTAANRWGGNNRGGWSHPEYERLYEAWQSTLDGPERTRLLIRMMAFVNEVLPVFQAYFRFDIVAHLSDLEGPAVVTPEGRVSWNVHEWRFTK